VAAIRGISEDVFRPDGCEVFVFMSMMTDIYLPSLRHRSGGEGGRGRRQQGLRRHLLGGERCNGVCLLFRVVTGRRLARVAGVKGAAGGGRGGDASDFLAGGRFGSDVGSLLSRKKRFTPQSNLS